MSVSHTTRPMRPGEKDGVAYHFVSPETFEDMQRQGAFLEQARVFGNRYGTSRQWVEAQLAAGLDVILEIDWQGAAQIRKALPHGIAVFILPPSRQALQQRLARRGQDDADTIAARMAAAVDEISHHREADYIVINDDFEKALAQLHCVVQSQRLRGASQRQRWGDLLRELLG